jgi:hypothetical protein
MEHLTEKQFFSKMISEIRDEYNLELVDGFPLWILKIFFPQISDDERHQAVDGLYSNDDSIDGFFI